jgi:DNA-binding FadR family transcriptional regulator
MQLFGVLLIVNGVGFTAWWIATGQPHSGYVLLAGLLAVSTGIYLYVQGRTAEVAVHDVGSIKAAAERAMLDAKEIAEIRRRIESQMATVAFVARQAVEARKLSNELALKNELVEKKISHVDETLEKANRALTELHQISEFIIAVVAALNDDRKAFDQLRVWSENKSHLFSSRAQHVWDTIVAEHSKALAFGGFALSWRAGLDPSKLTLGELKQTYDSSPATLKPALLEYIWKRQDIPRRDKLQFFAEVIEHDQSLTAVEYAGRYFTEQAGLKIKPLAVDDLLKWWRDNKDRISDRA